MRQKQNFVRVNISMDRLKLELFGNDAERCLREVNKVLDKVMHFSHTCDDYAEHLDLTEEMLANSTVTKLMTNFSQIYEDYRTNRVAIENKKVVELDKGKVESQMDNAEVKKSITKLLFPIQRERVKKIIVHVKGSTKDEANRITELIEQELQQADIHPVFTKSEGASHTIVEGIFFGDFAPEYDED
ncbi:MAG TPA: hypothetical protein VJH88_04385 [Candidatus Nanoarchaeia archaeon]|nr:hypothetical protein [Candidatus Nanoarchaeia archaeon]